MNVRCFCVVMRTDLIKISIFILFFAVGKRKAFLAYCFSFVSGGCQGIPAGGIGPEGIFRPVVNKKYIPRPAAAGRLNRPVYPGVRFLHSQLKGEKQMAEFVYRQFVFQQLQVHFAQSGKYSGAHTAAVSQLSGQVYRVFKPWDLFVMFKIAGFEPADSVPAAAFF